MPERPAENFRQQEQLTFISNPQPLPDVSGHAPSPRQSTMTVTMETIPLADHSPHLPPIDPTKRVQIFYEDPQVTRRDECSIVAEPEAAIQPPSPSPSLFTTTVQPTITEAADCARQPETRLPDYSPHLPPLDFTKTGKSFFADLRNKRIISEYDQDRFFCWCHVANRGRQSTTGMPGNSHRATMNDQVNDSRRYQRTRWLAHASKCPFYKVSFLNFRYHLLIPLQNPWETTGLGGTGARRYPQFPLQEPISQREALGRDCDQESAASYLASGEKRRTISDSEPGQTMNEDINAHIDTPEQPRPTRGKFVEYRSIQVRWRYLMKRRAVWG
jgi:hypothetical protein